MKLSNELTVKQGETANVSRTWALRIALLVLLLAAAALRFHEIGRRSIWFDEAVTLATARLPFYEWLRHAWDTNLNNQLLYYLLFRPWYHLFGEAESTVRAFSALFSIGGVALVYAVGRRLFGTAAGMIAGLLFALHPGVIWYAQEARSYSLSIFLSLLSLVWFIRFLEDGALSDLLGWCIAGVSAFYAHFFAGLVVGAQIVSLLFAVKFLDSRQRKMILGGLLGMTCFALPIIVHMVRVPKGFVAWIPPISLSRLIYHGKFLAGGVFAPFYLLLAFLCFFALLSLRLLRQPSAAARWRIALVLAWAILPIAILGTVSLHQPILNERYVLFAVPGWVWLAGAVVGPWLGKRRILAGGAVLLLALIVSTDLFEIREQNTTWFEDWRTPVEQVVASTLPGDVILYDSSWAGIPFEYYLSRARRRPRAVQTGNLLVSSVLDLGLAADQERVWLVLSRPSEVAKEIQAALFQSHLFWMRWDYGPLQVILYEGRRSVRSNRW